MGLKVLPPTLRKNNRYLTVDIKSVHPMGKDEFVSVVWDACVRFQGEIESSNFNLWVMRFYELEKCDGYYNYKSIVRCQRGYDEEVRSSLALVNRYKNDKISISTIGLSGTINASHRFI
ncbi:Rpp14/Pop5 family protein [Methanobrevibacter sp.]|uniref:Rpp14/Pop5 family protein n=1 Tax=Methanobrevibacter sp. TaxID=66852 RepID=UPI0026E017E4|nr:Rpp14/Pop5 family protein [Methanobrevibacter sp.]MDO5860772.1 Rpp14/Pop5 family protein [Methanobrevibacter sp.]